MHISLNEFTIVCRRALDGIGFPPGEYEDAADMVVWLEQHGLNGARLLGEILPRLTGEEWPALIRQHDDGGCVVMRMDHGSILHGGSLAADLACTRALETGIGIVRLRGCRDRSFVLGYLARCARRGHHIAAFWCTGEPRRAIQNVGIALADERLPVFRRFRADGGGEQEADTDTLTLMATRDFAMLPAAPTDHPSIELLEMVTTEEFDARSRRAWDQGIEVEPELWQQLKTLAGTKLVEATDASRTRGAGEAHPNSE
jgi:LDH2 family malate/lactate/ureidoglycolate dehydrogenase